jgi:hypothetical protein
LTAVYALLPFAGYFLFGYGLHSVGFADAVGELIRGRNHQASITSDAVIEIFRENA